MRLMFAILVLVSSAYAEDYKSIVKINCNTPYSQAHVSGAVIYSGDTVTILSCQHILLEKGKLSVTFFGEDNLVVPTELVKSHEDWDLSLFTVKRKVSVRAFPFAESDPKVGDKIRLYGYAAKGPHNQYVVVNNEEIYSMGKERMFVCDGPAIHGLSGTPFLDSTSRIVGVQSCGGKTHVMGSGLKTIRKFIKE